MAIIAFILMSMLLFKTLRANNFSVSFSMVFELILYLVFTLLFLCLVFTPIYANKLRKRQLDIFLKNLARVV